MKMEEQVIIYNHHNKQVCVFFTPSFGWLHFKKHGGLTNPQNASRGDSLSVSNGEQDLKMVRSGTEVMKSIYQLMHTEIVNEVNGFTPPTVLENGLRTQD
ncbi:hypothetical protein Bca101_019333 [Brassica carinata]